MGISEFINSKEMQETVEAASMGIWRIELFDGEQPRMKATPKMQELLGMDSQQNYTEEEIYETWYNRICPCSIQSVKRSVNLMKRGKRDENTYRWEHPRLGMRYVRCGGTAHKEEGKGYILVGYHYDVTDQVEKEKRESLVLNSLAQTYKCLYYIDLENGEYLSYHNDVEHIAKVVPENGSLEEGFKIFVEQLCKPEFCNAIRRFTDLDTLSQRLMTRDRISMEFVGATTNWNEVVFTVCDRNENGSPIHLIMSVRDIALRKLEEKKHLEQLKQHADANKSKTVMLQNMSHEIRTPLNAMFGFSQLLCMPDGCVTEEEKAEYFTFIQNSYNMLSMLIDDVLDLADVEHGNYRVVNGEIHVNDVCRQALQMSELRKQESVNLYFTSDIPDDYTIVSDGKRIQQILVNLMNNSCKHTTEGEIELHVSTSETPGKLTISVRDTGTGIPVDMVNDIFNRYKKADENVQGSGLGLNICSVLAEKLGGQVMYDKSYSGGARFIFVL